MSNKYFNFKYYRRSDKIPILLLLVLLMCSLVLRLHLQAKIKKSAPDIENLELIYFQNLQEGREQNSKPLYQANNRIAQRSSSRSSISHTNDDKEDDRIIKKINFAPFDPNTAHDSIWKNFGLSEKQVAVIGNYKRKGGRFYKAEDLQKIYSISESRYNEMLPFIEIKNSFAQKNTSSKPSATIKLEINRCDAFELTKNFGIPENLSKEVIRYRNNLGGFVSFDQLKEVEGISDSVVTKIQAGMELDSRFLKKININTCRAEEIRHPYIGKGLARLIENYRIQHGSYETFEQLKSLSLIDNALYNKLLPYLIVE